MESYLTDSLMRRSPGIIPICLAEKGTEGSIIVYFLVALRYLR